MKINWRENFKRLLSMYLTEIDDDYNAYLNIITSMICDYAIAGDEAKEIHDIAMCVWYEYFDIDYIPDGEQACQK